MRLSAVLSIALLCLTSACTGEEEADAVCGNGIVEGSENALTCCIDAGCARGVCDMDTMSCVMPWSLTCPTQTDACAEGEPYVCDSTGTPTYDCAQCGCPDGGTCSFGACYDPDVTPLLRSDMSPPNDWPLADYFAMDHWVMGAEAMTYAQMEQSIDASLREDSRRAALLLGESHGSTDEQSVGLQLIRDMVERGWPVDEIGVEGATPILDVTPLDDLAIPNSNIDGDLTNIAYCDAATRAVGQSLNDSQLYVQYTGSGHTSGEICHHPDRWGICDPPHTSQCLLTAGRKAVTVILFDPSQWWWIPDRILMWRTGDLYPDATAVTNSLDADIAGWDQMLAMQADEPMFDTTANGLDTNVRIVRSENFDDVYIAYFPRPGRRPYLLEVFRALWSDPTRQTFMLTNDIQPGNCSISWNLGVGEETFWPHCQNNGAVLSATIDGITYAVSDVVMTP